MGQFQCSGLVQFNTELARKAEEARKGLIEEVKNEEREFKVMGIRTQPIACLYKY